MSKAQWTWAAYLVGALRRLLCVRDGCSSSSSSICLVDGWARTRRVVRAQLLDSRLLRRRRRLLERPLPGGPLPGRLLARGGARAAGEAQAGLAAGLLERAGPEPRRPRRHLDVCVQRAEDASLGWRRGCAHLGQGRLGVFAVFAGTRLGKWIRHRETGWCSGGRLAGGCCVQRRVGGGSRSQKNTVNA